MKPIMTLQQTVKELGTTQKQISDTLRKMNIKGNVGRSCSCPIVKYLNACGFKRVRVNSYIVRYDKSIYELPAQSIVIPKALYKWISDFDAGLHQEFKLNF